MASAEEGAPPPEPAEPPDGDAAEPPAEAAAEEAPAGEAAAEKEEAAPAEEAPAEPPAEGAPEDGAPAEDAPAEEPPAEEPPAEEEPPMEGAPAGEAAAAEEAAAEEAPAPAEDAPAVEEAAAADPEGGDEGAPAAGEEGLESPAAEAAEAVPSANTAEGGRPADDSSDLGWGAGGDSPQADGAPQDAAEGDETLLSGAPLEAGYGDSEEAQERDPGTMTSPLDTEVQRIDVPDTEISTDVAAVIQRLQTVMESARATVGSHLESLPNGTPQDVAAWAERLDGLIGDLEGLAAAERSAPPPAPADAAGGSVGEGGLDDLQAVRALRMDLQSQRTGVDAGDIAASGLWASSEDSAKELSDLRCMRRQIRYLFGGGIPERPDTTATDMDDPAAAVKSLNIPASKQIVPHPPPPKVGRNPPFSGRTFTSTASSNSDAAFAQEERRRKDDRRDRKVPKQRRPDGSVEPRGEGSESRVRERSVRREPIDGGKRDDGTAAPKQWNWADEMVKASLDPHNQWEFPGSSMLGSPPRRSPASMDQLASKAGNPQPWEQPRLRSEHVASKARDRAEEVMRGELAGDGLRGYPRM